jgi:hypothetical protein
MSEKDESWLWQAGSPPTREEIQEIECAFNLGSEREREIIRLVADVAATLVKERSTAMPMELPTDVEERHLFMLALRVFIPQMEALRDAETN